MGFSKYTFSYSQIIIVWFWVLKERLFINRGKDSGVVVISLDEYNSLCATQHELSSKINENRLDSAIDKLKKGSSFQKELLD